MRGLQFPALFSALFPALALLFSCQTAPVQEELAETYYNLGNAYLELERLDEAESAYARAIELKPKLHAAEYNLARVYLFNGTYNSAESLLKQLLERDPQNGMVREMLAWTYIRMGRLEEAAELYREVLKEDPANCNVRYNLALMAADQKEWQEVHEMLIECVYLDRADGDILALLGRAERESGGGSGLGWFEEAADKKPQDMGIAAELADAYREEGLFVEALEVYDRIIEAEETETAVYLFEKAYINYTALEEDEEGLSRLEDALEQGFKDTEKIVGLLKAMEYRADTAYFAEIEDLLKQYDLYDSVMEGIQDQGETEGDGAAAATQAGGGLPAPHAYYFSGSDKTFFSCSKTDSGAGSASMLINTPRSL